MFKQLRLARKRVYISLYLFRTAGKMQCVRDRSGEMKMKDEEKLKGAEQRDKGG